MDSINRILRYRKLVKNFIRLLLRESSCDRVEILGISIPGMHHANKANRTWLSLSVLSFSVEKFCGRTDGQTAGRTDGHWLNHFVFAYWLSIYIHVHTSLNYFSYFTSLFPKFLFSIYGKVYVFQIWCRIGLSMCPRSRYTGLVCIGGIRSYGPMYPIFNTDLWLIEAYLQR